MSTVGLNNNNNEQIARKYTVNNIEQPQNQYEFSPMKLNQMILSSFILKNGDVFREHQAILHMFKFMNDTWKENNLKCKKGKYCVQCLRYKCIPMGNDVGVIAVIEMISNCIELDKVSNLTKSFIGNITETDNVYHDE